MELSANNLKGGEVYLDFPSVGATTSVGEPTIVHTKKFEEIINSDFVCDVKDDYAANKTEGLSNAEYRVMPKR